MLKFAVIAIYDAANTTKQDHLKPLFNVVKNNLHHKVIALFYPSYSTQIVHYSSVSHRRAQCHLQYA